MEDSYKRNVFSFVLNTGMIFLRFSFYLEIPHFQRSCFTYISKWFHNVIYNTFNDGHVNIVISCGFLIFVIPHHINYLTFIHTS